LSPRCDRLQNLLVAFDRLTADAPTRTLRVDVTGYPPASVARWKSVRAEAIGRLLDETGVDFSFLLTFAWYASAKSHGVLVRTVPAETLPSGRVSLVRVPIDELAESRCGVSSIFPHGKLTPINAAAWELRFAAPAMSNFMSGFFLTHELNLINLLVLSDRMGMPHEKCRPLAEAVRQPRNRMYQIALLEASMRSQMSVYHETCADNPLRGLPQGMCASGDAARAYAELILDDLNARSGPPAHEAESHARLSVANHIALAHGYVQPLLHRIIDRTLNSQR
jgi:hypothetical protein